MKKVFVSDNPSLVKEWDYDRNNKGPEHYLIHSNKKVWWKCKKGHSWSAKISNRYNGNGCPYCSNKIIDDNNNFFTVCKTLMKEWDFDKNTINPKNLAPCSGKYAWWKCEKGHSWSAKISNRYNGTNCPFCCGLRACPDNNLTLYPEIIKKWDYNKNKIGPENYTKGSNKKVWWKCDRGHSWSSKINSQSDKGGCPFCSGHKITRENSFGALYPELLDEWASPDDPFLCAPKANVKKKWKCRECKGEWETSVLHRTADKTGCPYCCNQKLNDINNFAAQFPELLKYWDYDRNDKLPNEYFPKSNIKVWWKCEEGHSWKRSFSHFHESSLCPVCTKYRVSEEYNFALYHPKLTLEWSPNNELGPNEYTPCSGQKVEWICPKGHIWNATIRDRARGSVCPSCLPTKLASAWLDKLKINKREEKVGRYRVDGLNGNTVYEFLGVFWHGYPKIYHPEQKNPRNNKKYGDLLCHTIFRFNKICKLGYEIIYCWENDKEKIYTKKYATKKEIYKRAIEIFDNKNGDILND